jgi:ribulose-phosphate 3-epimerase
MKDLTVVQLMSIATIGSYGAGFQESVLEKIRALRKKYPSVTIEIDGGVSLENAKTLIDAGVNNLIVGSAIWNAGDIQKTIQDFKMHIR